MRRLVALLGVALLNGCTTHSVLEFPTRNGLRVQLGLVDNGELRQVAVRARALSLQADGPDGVVSVSLPATGVGDLAHGPLDTLPPVELWSGDYSQVGLGLELASDQAPSLEAWGRTSSGPVHLVVPDVLAFSSLADELPVEDGVDLEVRMLLDPTDWLADLELPDDGEITPEVTPALYDVVHERILASMVTVWPGEVGPDFYRPDPSDAPDPEEGVGDIEGQPQPGVGVVTYRVIADVVGVDHRVGGVVSYTTEARVDLQDERERPVVGATVSLESTLFGTVTLDEDPREPGIYVGILNGYDRTFTLTVDGSEGLFEATAVGPAVPTLDLGPVPVDRAHPWQIHWEPSGGASASLATVGGGERRVPDTGVFEVADSAIAYELAAIGEEAVALERSKELALNGLAGSVFRVGVQRHRDPVDVVDSRVAQVEGQTGGSFDGDVPLRVVAWPAVVPTTSTPWAHATVWGSGDALDWGLELEPGRWRIQVYLDEDQSDGVVPLGPDPDEPSASAEATVEPDGTLQLVVDLD